MNHKLMSEWLQLSLYGELSEQEQTLLQNHLLTCDSCRHELEKLIKFHNLLSHRKPLENQDVVIQDARRKLRERIHIESEQRPLWLTIRDAIGAGFTRPVQVALGGTATLAVGILAGYLMFSSPGGNKFAFFHLSSSTATMDAGESQITNIRFVDRNTQSGDVEFMFETITPVHIRGNVNDERIQKVLARALVSDQNAGVRLRAVNMIGTQAEQKSNGAPKLETEVKTALITALLHDKNLGVRREALDVLKNYLPDPAIVHAFLNVLAHETNTGLKITAINSLDVAKYGNQPMNNEILDMLRNKAKSDDNNYIRMRAKLALQEVK